MTQAKEDRLAARRARYAAMPPAKKAEALARYNAAAKRKRQSLPPAEKEKQLAIGRERSRANRAKETPEQREKRLAYLKEYQRRNAASLKAKKRAQARRYYEKNRAEMLAKGRAYRRAFGRAVSARRAQKIKESPAAMLVSRLRHRLYLAFARARAGKKASTLGLVGCSPEFLVKWIESQFSDGMSFSNYGQWHVDHIIPCAAFDLSDQSQQRVAFHFTNLRPMWGVENAAKKDSLPVEKSGLFWSLGCIDKARAAIGLPAVAEVLENAA